MFDLTYNSFAVADKYRIPVMILADGMLGQMMEPLEYDKDRKPPVMAEKSWILTGAKEREARYIKSLFLGSGEKSLERHNEKLQAKYRKIEKEEVSVELYKTDDADKIIVAYGLCSRIGRSCVDALRAEGEKVGLMRPITLWPFPYDAIRKIAGTKDQGLRIKEKGKRKKEKGKVRFLVVEMSAGQMVEDVRLAVQDDERVAFYGRMGGEVPEEAVIVKKLTEM
jgi:2-oxoglutarate ferredoxin oxidoreductase subunit alpha